MDSSWVAQTTHVFFVGQKLLAMYGENRFNDCLQMPELIDLSILQAHAIHQNKNAS